jgi:hypothetical protein
MCGVERLVRSSLLDVNQAQTEVEVYKGPQSSYKRQLNFLELFLVCFWFSRFLLWKKYQTHLKEKCLTMWVALVLGDDKSSTMLCILQRDSFTIEVGACD